MVDESEAAAYEARGFRRLRRETIYGVPVTRIDAPVPEGVSFISAADADVDRLRVLDDELRQDIPGTDGWRWDDEGFRAETFSRAFDPRTYLVAVDTESEYVGIARIWNNRRGRRFGLIGVRREWRRRGLALALVAAAFAEIDGEVTTEIDDENVASRALFERLGARPVGAQVELVLPVLREVRLAHE